MATVLVWHDVSEEFAEIDERHLAHPILGPHYHIARIDEKTGKPYAITTQKARLKKAGEAEADVEAQKVVEAASLDSDKADK